MGNVSPSAARRTSWTSYLPALSESPLIAVLLAYGLYAIFLLSQHWLPVHDTLFSLLWSHQLLSRYATSGEIPLWSPFTDWGKDISMLLDISAQPSLLFLAPLVRVFPAINLASLFMLGQLIDELILILGTYSLARLTFQRASTVLLVTLSLFATAIWTTQIYWDFRLYYAMPLCLYLVASGARESELWRILLAIGIALFTGMLGTPVYPVVIQGLTLGVFALLSLWTERPKALFSRLTWREIACGVGIVAFMLLMVGLLRNDGDFGFRVQARDLSGRVDYANFLTYLADKNLSSLQGLLDGVQSGGDTTVFGGTLIIPLVFVALIHAFRRAMIPFFGTALFLVLFWAGKYSFVAPLLYYLPGVSFFRHIGLITPLLKIFLVFVAGFGLEALREELESENRKRGCLITCLVMLGVTLIAFIAQLKRYGVSPHTFTVLFIIALECVVILAVLARSKSIGKPAFTCLLVLALIDVFNFKSTMYNTRLVRVPDDVWALYKIRKLEYRDSRTENYFSDPTFRTLAPVLYGRGAWSAAEFEKCVRTGESCRNSNRERWGEAYNIYEPFLGFDPCFPLYRTDLLSPGVKRIYEAFEFPGHLSMHLGNNGIRVIPPDELNTTPEGHAKQSTDTRYLRPRHAGLSRITGCGHPKVAVFAGARSGGTDDELLKHLTSPSFQGDELFLLPGDGDTPRTGTQSRPVTHRMQVLDFDANRLRFKLTTPESRSSYWLSYSDAWHRNWRATVNGKPAPIYRAQLAFKAIEVPAGTAEIEWHYAPVTRTWIVRLLWALATAFIGGVGWLLYRHVRRELAK